ncbi:MAG: FixH family protein [Anaeromyxobacter sp.]|nr:FixH family protein [Anaeromyxobacter sp.]MBL0274520.1 FixH family protein [Anaeromyxobacter sp.]
MKISPLTVLLVVVTAVGLGSVAATLWIGAGLREEAVADASLEHGLRYDRDRALAAPLGLRATFDREGLRPGGQVLRFTLRDKDGAPLEGATIRVAITRPAGGGGQASAAAVPIGDGRYRADLGFAAPGFWDVRLDVTGRGLEVGLVQQVRVEGAEAPACQLAAGACRATAGPLELSLDLGRSLKVLQDLPVVVEVRRGGAPVEGATVEVAFAMEEMNMGENRVVLEPAGPGRYRGAAVLVRCSTGATGWTASVTVRAPGAAPESARFPFAVRQ